MEERHEEIVLIALKQVRGRFAHVWPGTVDLAILLKTMSTFQVYATLERLRIQGKIQLSPEEKITCCEGLPTTPASGDPHTR